MVCVQQSSKLKFQRSTRRVFNGPTPTLVVMACANSKNEQQKQVYALCGHEISDCGVLVFASAYSCT